MARLNAAWHHAHPMPRNATLDQRVKWHVAHARACGCRALPATVRAEIDRRKRKRTGSRRRPARR